MLPGHSVPHFGDVCRIRFLVWGDANPQTSQIFQNRVVTSACIDFGCVCRAGPTADPKSCWKNVYTSNTQSHNLWWRLVFAQLSLLLLPISLLSFLPRAFLLGTDFPLLTSELIKLAKHLKAPLAGPMNTCMMPIHLSYRSSKRRWTRLQLISSNSDEEVITSDLSSYHSSRSLYVGGSD